MSVITRSQMHYNDYSWHAIPGDDPRVSGPPDNTLLSRNEGYEVLYFINKFVERQASWNNETPASKINLAKKVEKMIRLVPGTTRSQSGIEAWIVANWAAHPNL